jgi:hypothetical protein
LTHRVAQCLEQGRAKGLCHENVASLYDDLMDMHSRCNYLDTHIWNCDESGAQVGWNGRGRILARRGIWSMHSITSYEKKWLFVLSCINILGSSIPNFYILKDKSFRHKI